MLHCMQLWMMCTQSYSNSECPAIWSHFCTFIQILPLQEAYEEFKRVLLALVYDKDDATSPVAEEVCNAFGVDEGVLQSNSSNLVQKNSTEFQCLESGC